MNCTSQTAVPNPIFRRRSPRLLAALGVAALLTCGLATGCQTSATKPGSAPAKVTGNVYYLQRIALAPDAKLTVQLLDVSHSDKPRVLATQTTPVKSVPAPFTLQVPGADIRPNAFYQLRAELRMAGQLWSHTTAYPVLTGGAPNYAEIVVGPMMP